MTKIVEFRVRPVTRYVLTRFESETLEGGGTSGGVETIGEFDNETQAGRVKTAMQATEGSDG